MVKSFLVVFTLADTLWPVHRSEIEEPIETFRTFGSSILTLMADEA